MKNFLLGYDATQRPICLTPQDRMIHMHVIGASDSGKSKFLESMMREDLKNRQGFALLDPHGTLYDEIVMYCARHMLDREIILLNLSSPESIIGFNPFRRAPDGDVSVQVDARVRATMHAWGVANTDLTPTLARTLWLIYTVMLEHNLGLPQVEHLIKFNARDVRSFLIEKLRTPLIQSEWKELHELKSKDWREEILSAKNRLFKLLLSDGIRRFMGLPDISINLREIVEGGKVLLVNLRQSKYLSHEGARTFGALLVNEFFETALQREKVQGHDVKPYYLYMDEFQNFVSLDIANMLDQVRKFGLLLILAHQRFGQLDENIVDAALTNCQIKTVFGGLSVPNARRMAEELFIGKLDPLKIKVAIHQTKFWPEYRRDKVYGRTSMTGYAHGATESSATASFSGVAAGQTFFSGPDWFASPTPSGTTENRTSGSNQMRGNAMSSSENYSTSESEIDIPIFFPVPFQELSGVQYFSIEEQLTQLTAALKNQFQRHCFIQIRQQETQPMLVPFVEPISTFTYSRKNLDWYIEQQNQKQHALPAGEIDRLLEAQETALLQAVTNSADRAVPGELDPAPIPDEERHAAGADAPIWPIGGSQTAPLGTNEFQAVLRPRQRQRGPKPDVISREKVIRIVRAYGDSWTSEENLMDVCDELDRQGVPVPKTWATRRDGAARTWSRGRQYYPDLVIKAIKDRCKPVKYPIT